MYKKKNLHFSILKITGYRPTDRRTDRPSYRDARTHLKMVVGLSYSFYVILSPLINGIVHLLRLLKVSIPSGHRQSSLFCEFSIHYQSCYLMPYDCCMIVCIHNSFYISGHHNEHYCRKPVLIKCVPFIFSVPRTVNASTRFNSLVEVSSSSSLNTVEATYDRLKEKKV